MMGGMNNSSKGRIVLITGSREFTKQKMVEDELLNIPTPAFILHGGARGADRLAAEAIHTIDGLTEIRMQYLNYHGKKGGYLRNKKMLEVMEVFRAQGFECWALAFHDDIKNPSPGTSGMVRLMAEADFSVVHIDEKSGYGFAPNADH